MQLHCWRTRCANYIICPRKSSTYYYWNTQSGSSVWYKNLKVLGINKTINQTVELINNILEKNNEFNFTINNLLKKFESGNKFEIYKELEKFLKNKDNNLLRYNLAVIQQKHLTRSKNYKYLIK